MTVQANVSILAMDRVPYTSVLLPNPLNQTVPTFARGSRLLPSSEYQAGRRKLQASGTARQAGCRLYAARMPASAAAAELHRAVRSGHLP